MTLCVLKIKRFYARLKNIFLSSIIGKNMVKLLVYLWILFSSLFFIYFSIKNLVHHLVKLLVSFYYTFATIKLNLFLCLFFPAYILRIVYHSHLFINFITKHIYSRLIYEVNFFNNNFNNFDHSLIVLRSSFELDFKFNVTVNSCMNSNFYEAHFYSLVQFTSLNIFKALTPESTRFGTKFGTKRGRNAF